MKTMKITIKQFVLASLFMIIFIGGSVNAKGTETEVALSHEKIAEPQLTIQDWMLNEDFWNSGNKTFAYNEESDKELAIESWMTEGDYWKAPETNSVGMEKEAEKDLFLENWMINEAYWN